MVKLRPRLDPRELTGDMVSVAERAVDDEQDMPGGGAYGRPRRLWHSRRVPERELVIREVPGHAAQAGVRGELEVETLKELDDLVRRELLDGHRVDDLAGWAGGDRGTAAGTGQGGIP